MTGKQGLKCQNLFIRNEAVIKFLKKKNVFHDPTEFSQGLRCVMFVHL